MKVLDFTFCISDRCFKQKAKPEEYAGLRNTFKNKKYESIEELKADLEMGKPFIAVEFDGTEKENGALDTTSEHIEHASAIVMDFEKGDWTEAKFTTFCKKYDIMPNIFYHSFSSTTRAERFRAIWIISRISKDAFRSLSSLVKLTFDIKSKGGIDAASLNITQQYHSTNKEIKILNEEYVNIENFIKCIYDLVKDDTKAKKMILKETKIEKIVNDNNEYEAKIGSYAYKYIKETGRIGFKFYKVIGKVSKNDKKMEADDYNNTNSSLLIKRCQLVRELITEKQDYYNYSLSTGLVYSLVKMRNGKDIYKEICDKNASSSWKTKERIFDDIKKKDYMPMACSKIGCPYFGKCNNNGYSPASLCKPTFKNLGMKQETLEINEARDEMYKQVKEAYLSDNNNTVNIIEAPVGTGKTYATIDLINDNIIDIKNNRKYQNQLKSIDEKRFLTAEQKEDLRKQITSKISEDVNSFIIASPRHNLCKQIKEDLLRKSNIDANDVIYIVPRPEFPNAKIEEKIKQLEELGLLKLSIFKENLKIVKEIKGVINGNYDIHDEELKNLDKAFELYPDTDEISKLDFSKKDYFTLAKFVIESNEYITSREKAKDANIVICTHAFLNHCNLDNFNQNVLFIDEDCSESFIQTHKVKIKTIEKMINILNNNTYEFRNIEYGYEDIVESLEYIISKNDGKIYSYNFMDCLKSPISKNKFKTGLTNKKLESLIELKRDNKIDLTTILNLRSFYISGEWVNFTTFKSLNTGNKKVILTSATPAPEFFYKNIFNKEIKMSKVPFVKLKGKLIQYIDMYCFRKNLQEKDYIDKIEQIKKLEKIDNVISYKAFNDELSNILSFGNLEGINEFQGEDMLIIGTYIVNPIACQLIARMFDNHNSSFDVEIVKQRNVIFNNIEQKFTTFENENAKNYQLWQCWKTMEQAVGRARLVSNDCKVVLLSKMIHPLAKTTTFDEEIN